MATHTVYGCKLADGTFEFSDTETGCEGVTITGCLVESGEHEGKVEITHDYGGCSTQYYACLDEVTGKFKFEVDDGCCVETVEADCCGADCDVAPKYLSVTISGVDDCGIGNPFGYCCGACEDYTNDTFILEFGLISLPLRPCLWYYQESCGGFHFYVFVEMEGFLAEFQLKSGFDNQSFPTGCFNYIDNDIDNDGCDICDNMPYTNLSNQIVCSELSSPRDTAKCTGENGTASVQVA